ncbi:primosomal protein N' [Methylomonas sp. MgM2]
MAKRSAFSNTILQVAIPVPLDRVFDYWPPQQADIQAIKPGMRISVPFGKSTKIGVVLDIVDADAGSIEPERIKSAGKLLDLQPLLSPVDLTLLHWVSRYYHHAIGEVVTTAFPVALRKGKPANLQRELCYGLTEQGRQADLDHLARAPKQKALLKLLQSQNQTLADHQLTEHKPALKILLNKGLVRQQEPEPVASNAIQNQSALSPSPQQRQAIEAVVAELGKFSVSLLQGVTGSGKTEVYMQIIAHALERRLQVLVLLPEITLTPQLERRFRLRFAVPIVCFHSKLNESQRMHAWLSMQKGDAAIMLGTRSSLFTPMQRPGLIILDEEHDSSFKQQEGFRFSARDVAIARAKMLNIPVLLGSATPSLESLFNVKRQRYRLLQLSARAGNAIEPEFQLLDIRNKPLKAGLSAPLIAGIRATLDRGHQILLFLNRRGFAPVLICHGCGWVSRCIRCDANMVIHVGERRLRCHHCGFEQSLIKQCPACNVGELQPLGMGTERIEHSLTDLFPGKNVIRLDKDTTQRKGTLEAYLEQIHSGHADIILGTQMLAKGHHFPDVTLVAILDIDSGLFSVDFHAGEKLAQMIIQVAGRAGRANKPGRVVLQTRQPQHPLLTTLIEKGYQAFAETALQERKQAGLPPYSHQALFRAHAGNAQPPQQFLKAAVQLIGQFNSGKTKVFGPVPAPMTRRAGQFRFQLLLQSPDRKDLHRLLDAVLPEIAKLKEASKVRWSLDVDPVDLY